MTNPSTENESMVERGKVVIVCSGEQRTIKDAFLFASLAVHLTPGRWNRWTITHRKTGCSIGYADSEEAAIKGARVIERMFPEVLAIIDKRRFGQTAPPTKRRPKIISDFEAAIKEMGLR